MAKAFFKSSVLVGIMAFFLMPVSAEKSFHPSYLNGIAKAREGVILAEEKGVKKRKSTPSNLPIAGRKLTNNTSQNTGIKSPTLKNGSVNAAIMNVQVLIVGGGGGGGRAYMGSGAGGGGGQVVTQNGLTVSSDITITVGSGGTGGTGGTAANGSIYPPNTISRKTPFSGANGNQSSFGSYIAYGGGGSQLATTTSNWDAYDDEKGGNAYGSTTSTVYTGGSRTYGNNGSWYYTGGGGAGSGGNGVSGNNNNSGANGGPGGTGVSSSLRTGSSLYYGGGGGGSGWAPSNSSLEKSQGTGGNGGGGNGVGGSSTGNNGTTNTGGGGGGSGSGSAGAGGSGIVVVRYAASSPMATGGTITSYDAGGTTYQVHTFTSSGTFSPTASGPTASVISGTTSICSGSSANLSVAITGGTSPFTVVYSNGTSNTTVNSYTSASNISVSPTTTTTYSIVSVTDANGLTGTGNSGSAVVTVNARPTPSFTTQPGATVCASTNVTYTTESGQSNYIWSLPGTLNTDYSITSGGVGTSSNTVTLKWLTAGSKTVTINYTAANGCAASSATSSTATTVNAVPVVSGVSQNGAFGNGLNLEGANDYVVLPKPISTAFTIEYWIKSSQTSPTGSQWYSGNGIVDAEYGGGTTDFGTALLNGKLAFGVGNGDVTIQSTTSINAGSWNHVAVSWNGTTGAMKLYINGTEEATTTGPTGTRAAVSRIVIGRLQTDNNNFNGSIDELRIWNVVRTQSEIQAAKNSEVAATETGLVAYYNFNQGTANGTNTGISTLTDRTSNGNNGTLYNFALTGSTSNWSDGAESTGGSSSTLTVCANSTIQLNNATAGGVWSTSDASIATVDNAGLVTGVAEGSVTISYTVTNASNCSTSATTTVTVNALPSFLTQPSSAAQSVCSGAGSLNVEVDPGSGTVASYKWYSNASNSTSGGTLLLTNTTTSSTNSYSPTTTAYYYVTATNSNGCVGTSTVSGLITVTPAPSISSQPSSSLQSLCINGTPTNLSVTAAAGSGTIASYKWYSNTSSSTTGVTLLSTTVGTSTTNSYTPSTATAGTTYYYCVVTNSNGCSTTSSVSGAITVVAASVAGTATAASTSVSSGGTTTLSLSGYSGSIQWLQSSDGSSWSNVSGGSGATTATYTTAALSATTYYRAEVTNGTCAVAYSNTLTIGLYGIITVTSFSPESGPTGSNITITGTNFNSTYSNNVVYFGATKAVVNSGTTTSLNVTVPIGATYKPLTVLNTETKLLAESARPFRVTFTGAISSTMFDTRFDISHFEGQYRLGQGDFNTDGLVDLAVPSNYNTTISVFKNQSSNGSLSFASRSDFGQSGTGQNDLTVADFNGDGKLDMVSANRNQGNINVLINNTTTSTISFNTYISYTPGSANDVPGIAVADFDKDGKMDIVVASGYTEIKVYRNTSTTSAVSFSLSNTLSTGALIYSITTADLNRDDKVEILTANADGSSVSVFKNTTTSTGSPNFDSKVDFAAGGSARFIAVGDMDGDNKVDMVTANYNGTSSVFRNLISSSTSAISSSSFATRLDLTAPQQTGGVAINDLDGDGKMDIALTTNLTAISIIKNNSTSGNLSFDNKFDFTANNTYTSGISIQIVDMDGDGRSDVVTTGAKGISIYRYGCVSPSISSQPSTSAQSLCLNGSPTAFSITASAGAGSISGYQWYSNTNNSNSGGTLIAGATSSSYTPLANTSSTLYYYCIVTNSSGCTKASNVSGLVTVSDASVSGTITGAGTVTSGTNSTILTLSGYTSTIQWQSSTNNTSYSNIVSATSATYTVTNLTATTFYRAVVTNGACAAATSNVATITVASASTAFSITGSTSANTMNNNVATVVDPNIEVTANGTVSGFTVTITGDYTDGDVLGYTGSLPSGVTAAAFNTTSRSLNFTGSASAADWQTLLRTVTMTSTSNCYPTYRKVSFLPSNKYYNYFNGHYYEYVSTALSWTAAKSAAASRSFYGRKGYLVTISSEAENNYIWKLISQNSWIGLSCVHTEINSALGYTKFGSTTYGQFYWVTGPEKGTAVSTGLGGSLTAASGVYNNWTSGEPNNYNRWGENSGHMFSTSGKWNDFRAEGANNGREPIPYIVEYGGSQGDDVSATISFTRDIIISGSPAGSVTGAATVCNGTNTTTLTFSGSGTIQRWEYSTDNFVTAGTTVASTASTLTATNLSSSRYYRAVVNTSGCSNLASSSALITVATSTAGSITATSADVCAGGSAALTLNGNSGDIQKWQVSTSSGFTTGVTDISNTTNSLSYALSSNGTYYFRAAVLNSACVGGTAVYTEGYPVTVTTGTPPVGGTVNSVAYCGGSNAGTLTLSGSTGTSYQWEVSTDGGVVYTNASSTSTTQSYTGISTTTKYRVLVTNGSCGSVYSSVGTITIGGTSGAQWTGGTSTDWGNTANWCGYIIGDNGLDVTISSTATYAPTLDQNRTIGNLNFNSANKVITLGNYTLTATSFTNAAASNYVKTTGTGKLKVSIGNGITTSLPVGNTAYNPVSITNNNNAADYFSVKVLDEVYANSVSGSLNNSGRVQRTWDITKTNANSGSGVDFVFNWNAGETSSFTTASLYNYSGGTWVGQTGTTSSTSTSLTYRGYTGTMSSFAILSGFTWTGLAGDNLWNTAGNWSTGTTPLATTDIIISSGTPRLNVDYAVGGTLTISGTGTLTINPGKTLSISTGGVVDFGGKSVTIKSDITGTAQLGRIQGTLSGATNVTVERYIPATGRKYRMIAPSVNSTGSIKANWMEGNMNTVNGTNINTLSSYGTQITGPGGNTNGFDVTGTNAASLYLTTNGVTPGYTSVANTNGTLNALTGYFLFIRGDRATNMNLFNTNVPPTPIPLVSSSTTLRATGTIVQGTVTSFTNALSSVAGGFSLITNPYPAAIYWDSVYAASTNLNNYYSYWDPKLGFRGGFVTVNSLGVNSSVLSLASKIIQSGQAFFVTTTVGGITPTISIKESHKVGPSLTANNVHGIFKANMTVDDIVSTKVKGISPVWENYQPNLQQTTSIIPEFSMSLYYTEADGTKRLTDGAVALFDNQYTSALDGNDAVDAPNWDENIAITRNGQNLAIESRAALNENDTLAISMSGMKSMNYELQFQGNNFGSTLLQPMLIDNYLNTLTPLSLTQSTTVPFTVTSNAATSSKDRFKVVFKTAVVLPFSITKISTTKKNETVQVDWEVKTDEELKGFDVERSSDGRTFVKLVTVASLGKGITVANYIWVDNNPLMGVNYYRIKVIPQVGKEKLSPVANVTMDKYKPTMMVYPNPTEGNDFNIKLSNLTKGSYQIIVTTASGQQVLVKTMEHPGGTKTQRMVFDNDISKGVYRVQVKGEGLSLLSSIIKN